MWGLQVVQAEIESIDSSSEKCIETIDDTIGDVIDMVQARKREMMLAVQCVCAEKKRVLREQLDIIEKERNKVRSECEGLQTQLEVRNITKKIADLNEKLDMSSNLVEPRENAFVKLEFEHNNALNDLRTTLAAFGRIRISKTFPALCTARIEKPTLHLRSRVVVSTVDYNGEPRSTGCDPLVATLTSPGQSDVTTCEVTDHENGRYTVEFTPRHAGSYEMKLEIFGRALRDSPLVFDVSAHHNPVAKVGARGAGELQFVQPIAIALRDDDVFVLDTGNSRIKVLDRDLRVRRHLARHGLEEHSGTGLAVTPRGTLVVTNWRTRHVTELSGDGEVLSKFTHRKLEEPIAVAVNRHDEVIVADNSAGKLLVFSANGDFKDEIDARRTGSGDAQLKLVTSVYAVPQSDDVLVTDHRLQRFRRDGSFVREYRAEGFARGTFGGVTVDARGDVLATHQDKSGARVLYFSADGQLKFAIDSFDDRLKRPSGLATTDDGHVLVVDLGNDAVKKFRYA